jgi:hypothetical protein
LQKWRVTASFDALQLVARLSLNHPKITLRVREKDVTIFALFQRKKQIILHIFEATKNHSLYDNLK